MSVLCPCFVGFVCFKVCSHKLDFKKKRDINGNSQITLTANISSKAKSFKNSGIVKRCFSLYLHHYIQWHYVFPSMHQLCISGCLFSKQNVTVHNLHLQHDLSKSFSLKLKILSHIIKTLGNSTVRNFSIWIMVFWRVNRKTRRYLNIEAVKSSRYGLWQKLWAVMLKSETDENLESNLESS